MSILQFVWIGDLDETKTQILQNPQALNHDRCHPKKMVIRTDKKETRIGRKNSKMPPDYALESAVSNRMISRNHVTVERLSKGNYMLYDHSLNGTYVNFVRVIGGTILKHEDIVCFGHVNGANIKPGEAVTPFATDLKYRVEILDKNSAPNDRLNMSNRKIYSQSDSSQDEDVLSDQKHRNKMKQKLSDKNKRMKMSKQQPHDSDESEQSSDDSDDSNNNANDNFVKRKKPADLSSLSSSNDGDDDGGRIKSKFHPKKSDKSTKRYPNPSDSRANNNSSDMVANRKKKSEIGNNNQRGNGGGGGGGGLKKSHDNSRRSKPDERSYPPMKDRKLQQHSQKQQQQQHSKSTNSNKYSDNTNSKSSAKRNSNLNSSYEYEECSARPCLHPDGENLIDWIMCDKCTLWFHQSCVGLDEAVEDDESYYCPYCLHG